MKSGKNCLRKAFAGAYRTNYEVKYCVTTSIVLYRNGLHNLMLIKTREQRLGFIRVNVVACKILSLPLCKMQLFFL